MNKDYIDALWHEAELASVNSDLEIHQIFYNLIEKTIRADEREACAKVCEKEVAYAATNLERSAQERTGERKCPVMCSRAHTSG